MSDYTLKDRVEGKVQPQNKFSVKYVSFLLTSFPVAVIYSVSFDSEEDQSSLTSNSESPSWLDTAGRCTVHSVYNG